MATAISLLTATTTPETGRLQIHEEARTSASGLTILMVDTNAILSIAFSLIANFTNVVEVPPKAVPRSLADLEQCVIGSPASPFEMVLFHRTGARFGIRYGVVASYWTPGSFFTLQDLSLAYKFTGTAIMTTNQALELATITLQRLVKTGNPLTNGSPRLQVGEPYQGKPIPFYRVTWPNGNGGLTRTASVEIDGRTGKIVDLVLLDSGFLDFAFEQQISNKVYTPDPRPMIKRKPIRRDLCPLPTTNQVTIAISNWLAFCEKIGMDPGNETNIDHVNWNRTFLATEPWISATVQVCKIRFNNGASFASLDGVAFGHLCPDACFSASNIENPRERKEFEGTVNRRWQDLAKELEVKIEEKSGIPKSAYKNSELFESARLPNFGEHGVVRALVYWHRLPREPDSDPAWEDFRSYFDAEFDVQTGQLKGFNLHDPELIKALCRAQSKQDRKRQAPARIRRIGAEREEPAR